MDRTAVFGLGVRRVGLTLKTNFHDVCGRHHQHLKPHKNTLDSHTQSHTRNSSCEVRNTEHLSDASGKPRHEDISFMMRIRRASVPQLPQEMKNVPVGAEHQRRADGDRGHRHGHPAVETAHLKHAGGLVNSGVSYLWKIVHNIVQP